MPYAIICALMAPKSIFITGATGCLGHYLTELFLADDCYNLVLMVRDPDKFLIDLPPAPKVRLVHASLEDWPKFAEAIKKADYFIHAATSWGGADKINYEIPFQMFEAAAGGRVRRIINFSTASLLDENNRILEPARQFGTDYIKSKLKLHETVKKQPWADKVVTVFPTLIVGGDQTHPFSYITQVLPEIKKWIGLARFFSFDAGCHFIHAADAAAVVKYLLDNDQTGDFALGNKYQTAQELLRQAARYFGRRVYGQIPLPIGPLVGLARLIGVTFLPWDLYCARSHRHFRYRTVNPANFDLPVKFPDLASYLRDAGITQYGQGCFSKMS